MAAALAAAAIGAGASIFGAKKAADATKSAAKGIDRRFQEGKALMAPYTGAGENALEQYGNAVGLGGRDKQKEFYDNFQTDPGFETSLNNALSEATRRYAIIGNTGGGLANALLKTGQNALYGQYKDRLSQLGGIVDTGRSAATSVLGAGQQAAVAQGNMLSQAGQLQGQGIIGAGQAGVFGIDQYQKNQLAQAGMAAGQNPMPQGFGTSWTPWTTNRASF